MELTGKIKLINETKEFGSNGFKKRELVLTTDEQYPQHIIIEFVQDKCGILDKYKVGQDVKVGLNLRGREWTNPQGEVKYFNTIQGWRIDGVNSNEAPPVPPAESFEPVGNSGEEDLPF